MEITEVKVYPVKEEKLKAFVSVVLDACFMVNDIKVIQGREGLFISMPSRRKKNGEFKDVAHPLNNATRQMMESCILREYDRVLDGRGAGRPGEAAERSPTDEPAAAVEGKPTEGPETEERRPEAEKSLDEVAELHLRDSFWTT